MLLATGVRRAWLEQTNGTYLPVLIVRHCKGSDIYINSKCEKLTHALECHLTYEEPPQRRVTQSTLNRINREWDNRERLIWDSADHDQLRQLHGMGHKPASNKAAVRLQRALTNHEAKTQRDAAKAAQQAEKERRKIIRQERAKLRAEREAAAAEKGPRKVRTPDKDQSEPAVESSPESYPQKSEGKFEPAPTPKPELKIEPVPSLLDFKIEALIKQIQQQSAVAA